MAMQIPEVTVDQMKEVDRLMIEEFHISLLQMMENAGRILAKLAVKLYKPKKVIVLAGKGNNGGGGLVAARYLHNHGVDVKVLLADSELKETPLQQLETLRRLGVEMISDIEKADLFIDALLGYNAVGEPRGKVNDIIGKVNSMDTPVLSLDVPTGFDLVQGRFHDVSFDDATVLALALPKVHMKPNIKTLYMADIGVPKEVYEEIGIETGNHFSDGDYVRIS